MTTPTARSRRASVREIIDAVTSDPVVAIEAHDGLWAAIWARKYQEVYEPVWAPEAAWPGVVVYGRDFLESRGLVMIDTDDQLVAAVVGGPTAPVGSTVVIAATPSGDFALTAVQAPGLGIELRFDDHDLTTDRGWVDRLREALHRIREAQAARRTILERERKRIGFLQQPPAIEAMWKEALGKIRERVEAATLYSPAELDRLEKARGKRASDDARKQREGAEAEAALVTARQQRFNERARVEVDALRARWPEVIAQRNALLQKYFDYKASIQRIESMIIESRAVTDLTWSATRQLDDIDRAGLRVRHLALPDASFDDPQLGRELVRTIDVCHRAIAHRMRHIISDTASPRSGPPHAMMPRLDGL